jgi:RNA polymerase sigma-70 factor, ECF subfamily
MLPTTTGLAISQGVKPAVLCGNMEELGSVVSRCLPMFYKRAFRKLGNAHDAEDAVQDALLSAYQHLSQFRGEAQLSTWLTTIVINATRMKLRRKRSPDISFDQQFGEDQGTALWEQVADERPSPEEVCSRRELHDRLVKLMDRLSPPMRRTFQFCDLDGLTTREVAEMLGVAQGAIKGQLWRARGKLTRLLHKGLALPRRHQLAQPGASTSRISH